MKCNNNKTFLKFMILPNINININFKNCNNFIFKFNQDERFESLYTL